MICRHFEVFACVAVTIRFMLETFSTAANHHAECHRHQDHLWRLPPFAASVQQRGGHRQAAPRVQLGASRREVLRVGHPQNLHDGSRNRPEHRAHGGGLLQRLRPSGEDAGRPGCVGDVGLRTVHQQLRGLHPSLPHKEPTVRLRPGPGGSEQQRRAGGHRGEKALHRPDQNAPSQLTRPRLTHTGHPSVRHPARLQPVQRGCGAQRLPGDHQLHQPAAGGRHPHGAGSGQQQRRGGGGQPPGPVLVWLVWIPFLLTHPWPQKHVLKFFIDGLETKKEKQV